MGISLFKLNNLSTFYMSKNVIIYFKLYPLSFDFYPYKIFISFYISS